MNPFLWSLLISRDYLSSPHSFNIALFVHHLGSAGPYLLNVRIPCSELRLLLLIYIFLHIIYFYFRKKIKYKFFNFFRLYQAEMEGIDDPMEGIETPDDGES